MTRTPYSRAILSVPAAALLVASAACGGTNVIGPENQLEVTNVDDSFQWQVTALDNVTQTLTYTWTMTGTVANVNQASALGGGSATVTVQDAAGTQVYTSSLSQNGTFTTSAGTAGAWKITVTLDEATGTLNFRVQKP